MKGRETTSRKADVGVDAKVNNTNPRPVFNYRTDLRNLAPVWGLLSQMVLSILLSCLTGAVVAYLLSVVAGLFEVRVERTAETLIWWLWPAFAFLFMWKYFDVRTHVKIGEGAFATISLGGGWQFRWFKFNGEISTFPWITVWKHNLGGNTLDVECTSAFVRVDRNNPEAGSVEVFSGGDKPPRLIFSIVPLNPFKMVRRVAQDGPSVVFENLNDIAEAVLKEALQHESVDLNVLMSSHEFPTILRKVFQELTDDEGQPRCCKMEVGERDEYVIDTGYGPGIYNVQGADLGPSKAIRDELSEKMRKQIEAEAKATALRIASSAVREAGDGVENAMALTGDLSGDEFKIGRTHLAIDIPGLTGEQKVRVAEAVGTAAPAVAAFLGGRSQSPKGQGGKKGDKPQTPKPEKDGDKKPDKGSEAPKPKQEGGKESPFSKRRWRLR